MLHPGILVILMLFGVYNNHFPDADHGLNKSIVPLLLVVAKF
jgi:hypothetical protein